MRDLTFLGRRRQPVVLRPEDGGRPTITLESLMSERVTVYEKPTCSTCRNLVKLLEAEGVPFERVNYVIDPLDRATLERLLNKAGLSPRDVLRIREPEYRDLGLADRDLTDDVLLDALVRHPALLQRPIVERGARAVLARPVERVRTLFGPGPGLPVG